MHRIVFIIEKGYEDLHNGREGGHCQMRWVKQSTLPTEFTHLYCLVVVYRNVSLPVVASFKGIESTRGRIREPRLPLPALAPRSRGLHV